MSRSDVNRVVLVFCLLLAGLAVAVSVLMLVESATLKQAGVTPGLAFCPETELLSCETVLASRYAQWLGIPLAGMGLANYGFLLAIFGVICIARSYRLIRGLWLMSWTLAALGTLAGLWLLAVQVFDLKVFCLLCDIVHACGLTLLVLLTWQRPSAIPVRRLAPVGVLAVVATMVLVAGQMAFEPQVKPEALVATSTKPAVGVNSRTLATGPSQAPVRRASIATSTGEDRAAVASMPGESFKILDSTGALVTTLDLREQIILGDPSAERTLVEFIDYGCKHCKKMSALMKEVLTRHPRWFRVVVILLPGNKQCNPYVQRRRRYVCEIAKAALAVRKRRPDLLPRIHETFFRLQGDFLTDTMAWQVVKRLCSLDDATLKAWREDPTLEEQLSRHVDIGGLLNVRRLPTIYGDGKVIAHTPSSAKRLEQIITDLIGPPPADELGDQ